VTQPELVLTGYDVDALPALTDLWIAAWTKAMPAIDFEARRGWFVEHIAALEAAGVGVTCAFDKSKRDMAGFITLDAANGHIDQLAVAPAYWETGAAAALLAHAKTKSPGTLRLEVNQANARAVRFYEKHGFRRRAVGVNPNSGLKTWHYEWRGTPS
jgi:putative acetyltransferase